MPRKPVAFGVNRDEGVLFAVMFNDKIPITTPIYNGVLSLLFKDQKDQILALDRYNPAKTPAIPGFDPAVTAFANLMTDYAFTCGNIAIANKLLDEKKSKPIYGYFFTQKPFFDLFAKVDGGSCSPAAGNVCHAFELPYVFNLLNKLSISTRHTFPPHDDTVLAGLMTKAWYAYAVEPATQSADWIPYTSPASGTEKVWGSGRLLGPQTINLAETAQCNAIWLKTWPYRPGALEEPY